MNRCNRCNQKRDCKGVIVDAEVRPFLFSLAFTETSMHPCFGVPLGKGSLFVLQPLPQRLGSVFLGLLEVVRICTMSALLWQLAESVQTPTRLR